MATLLDYRSSIHAPFESFGPVALPITPTLLLGDIGLIVGNATSIRVELQGQIGVQAVVAPANVFILIYRDGEQIYWAADTLDTNTIKLLAVNAADTVASSPTRQIQYRLFAYTNILNNVNLVGPMNFEGSAVSN
jgi:hypothetical protein